MQNNKARAVELIDEKIVQFINMEKQITRESMFDDNFLEICFETGSLLEDLFSREEENKFLRWAMPGPTEIELFRRGVAFYNSYFNNGTASPDIMEEYNRHYVDKYRKHLEGIVTLLNTFKDIILYGDMLRTAAGSHPITSTLPSSFRNLPTGTRIGNYIITSQLGVGGIGAVYLARQQFVNQLVAIKVHDFFPSDTYVSIAFFRASNYLSQLNHPNIVYLHDYGFESGRAYQAMEYVDGSPLTHIIPNQQTKAWTDRCLAYLKQLLSALLYAHNCKYYDIDGSLKHGIIHGDIKPHNILWDRSKDTVKLADFMIPDVQAALGRENFDFRMATTAAYGTPAYMVPEQKEGKVTQQTDIFSLGVTMYQLVTGYGPHDEEGAEAMWQGTTPQQINPYVSDWLDKMIVKAMQRDPANRFKTVAEMMRIFIKNEGQEKSSLIIKVKEWIMGDQINNQIGDISNVSGQLFIGKFNNVIASLNANGQTELAETLKTLKEAVMASKLLSDDEKQEQVEVINQIGEEAAKPKPNKTLLKVLGDGLMATLRAVPDVAKAVAAAAPIFAQLHL